MIYLFYVIAKRIRVININYFIALWFFVHKQSFCSLSLSLFSYHPVLPFNSAGIKSIKILINPLRTRQTATTRWRRRTPTTTTVKQFNSLMISYNSVKVNTRTLSITSRRHSKWLNLLNNTNKDEPGKRITKQQTRTTMNAMHSDIHTHARTFSHHKS